MAFLSGLQGGLAAALSDPSMMSLIAQQPAKAPQGASGGRRGGGFLGGLRNAFDPSRIAMMQATLSGDYGTAAQIAMQQQLRRAQQQAAEAQAEAERDAEGRRQEALAGEGLSKDQIVGMRPEEASRLIFERSQPRQFGPEGGSIYDPQTGNYNRAPSRNQVGRSIVDFDANSNTPNTLYEGVEPVSVQPGGAVYGMNGRGQIVNPGGQGAPASGGPQPGQVVNGYRFKGGNPNDRNSWEPVQGGAGGGAQTPFADAGRYGRISRAESGGRDFGPNGAPVRSPRGAMYAMQVMPDTAARPGFGIAPARNNSPAEYNRVGREYIDRMVQEFGSEAAGAAAYNFGPANFRNLIRRHPNDWRNHLPRETQDYLRRQGL